MNETESPTPQTHCPPRKLLTRLAFKGDQEVFTASWAKVRSKNTAIDQEVAGPLVLAFVQHLLKRGGRKGTGLNTTHRICDTHTGAMLGSEEEGGSHREPSDAKSHICDGSTCMRATGLAPSLPVLPRGRHQLQQCQAPWKPASSLPHLAPLLMVLAKLLHFRGSGPRSKSRASQGWTRRGLEVSFRGSPGF